LIERDDQLVEVLELYILIIDLLFIELLIYKRKKEKIKEKKKLNHVCWI